MKIEPGATVAVVVIRNWADLEGVRQFLRPNENLERRRPDGSYTVFAKLLDDADPLGLWIELNSDRHRKDPRVKTGSFLIP